jgi:hypothetical protein
MGHAEKEKGSADSVGTQGEQYLLRSLEDLPLLSGRPGARALLVSPEQLSRRSALDGDEQCDELHGEPARSNGLQKCLAKGVIIPYS